MSQEQHIAVIDDDASMREALAGLLRALGHRGAAFGSAEEFLAAGAGRAYACIVSDIQLPGLSGFELAAKLAQQGVAAPLIMITARAEPDYAERARAAGAVCLLKKPFAGEAFIACLERALARRAPPG